MREDRRKGQDQRSEIRLDDVLDLHDDGRSARAGCQAVGTCTALGRTVTYGEQLSACGGPARHLPGAASLASLAERRCQAGQGS
ncbi:hypothetical protein C0Q70_15407 [Pomacea canaliculata]|uniref:Uncharacterized protein n=1 Tax=Pomacea canaliculata TaxID=400727 RepID=A0A2T7NUT5_POMCA|nr:hypothetical protein C0Q70_15407 [Pomacea canaliculata]